MTDASPNETGATAGGGRRGLAWIPFVIMALGALILGMVLWQCSSASTAGAAEPGLAQFRLAGCASCHGSVGEGGTGPAMAGHRAEQVIRQVRAPLGAMPLYTPTELDEAKLTLIVDWVVDLGADGLPHDQAHAHGSAESDLDPREVLLGHHWMALSAILIDDPVEALHHAEHAFELTQGTHRLAMFQVLELLQSGDLTEAEERIKEMLADYVPEAGSIDRLHAALALQALGVGDAGEAIEHLERVGAGPLAEHAGAALDAIHRHDLDQATVILVRVISEDEGHDDEAEPHDDEDADHHDDEAEPHDDEDADHHDDEAEPHDDEDADHHDDEAEPHDDEDADHHDDEAEPHDDEDADDHGDEAEPHDDEDADDHGDEVEPHDDEGTEPHDHEEGAAVDGEVEPHDDEGSELDEEVEPHDDEGTEPHDH